MIDRQAIEASQQADRMAWLISHRVINPAHVAERCRWLPAGHWHCKHGHVVDCPFPTHCEPVDL